MPEYKIGEAIASLDELWNVLQYPFFLKRDTDDGTECRLMNDTAHSRRWISALSFGAVKKMVDAGMLRYAVKEDNNAKTPRILDSGNRRKFETGAVRDICEGKGRCDLLPLEEIASILDMPDDSLLCKALVVISSFLRDGDESAISKGVIVEFINENYADHYTAILELAKHYEEGAKKYAERNWEQGIPLHCYVDSGIRHLLKHYRGDTDEPHDRAFLWNMFGLLWTLHNRPECNDLPFATKEVDDG